MYMLLSFLFTGIKYMIIYVYTERINYLKLVENERFQCILPYYEKPYSTFCWSNTFAAT